MSCPHCHNEKIRTGERLVDLADIAQEILSARRYVSALVISGGEPVMQPEVCLELLIWGHALGLKVAIETSGCRPIPEGFDRIFLSIQCSLERWIYDAYTLDLKSYDNVIHNLKTLDPKTSEVRYVIHAGENFETTTFRYISSLGFPIRLLKGDRTSLEKVDAVGLELADLLGLRFDKGVLL